MAVIVKIWKTYVFGQLDADGSIKYFTPTNNRLAMTYQRADGSWAVQYIANPTETQMNQAGWYRVVNVAEDGTDNVVDNILYHYTGTPDVEEPIEEPVED